MHVNIMQYTNALHRRDFLRACGLMAGMYVTYQSETIFALDEKRSGEEIHDKPIHIRRERYGDERPPVPPRIDDEVVLYQEQRQNIYHKHYKKRSVTEEEIQATKDLTNLIVRDLLRIFFGK